MKICIKTKKEACPSCQPCTGPVCYIEVLEGELNDYAETVSGLNAENAALIEEMETLQGKLKRIIE